MGMYISALGQGKCPKPISTARGKKIEIKLESNGIVLVYVKRQTRDSSQGEITKLITLWENNMGKEQL